MVSGAGGGGGVVAVLLQPMISLLSIGEAGASVLVSDGCAVARVGHVGTPDVWLQPGPWLFLASVSAPLLLVGMVLDRAWWFALRPVAYTQAAVDGSGA